ncbi:MAG: hypothetical protein AAFY02_02585 [Pseudomonadota bacterium]
MSEPTMQAGEIPAKPSHAARFGRALGRSVRGIGQGLAMLWPGRRLVGIAVLTLLVLGLLFPLEARDHLLKVWRAFDRPAPNGLILVDSPQIFTRERLVNDRFTEERWLASQLENTDALLADGRFARPYQWMQETIKRSMGTPTEGAQDDLLPAPETARPAPLWEYEDALAYRNRIRYAKIATQLDDAHDIDSNTLYRMNFSISVLPDREEDAIAVVKIQVHESDRIGELERYYAQLLGEYVDVLQRTVTNVYNDRLSTIEQGQSFSPAENVQVDHFLRHQIEVLLPRLMLPVETFEDDNLRRQAAEAFLNQALGAITRARLEFDRRQNELSAGSLVASLGDSLSPEEKGRIFSSYLGLCQNRSAPLDLGEVVPAALQSRVLGPAAPAFSYPLPCNGLPRNWQLQARFQIITAIRAITAQLYQLKDYSLPMSEAGRFLSGPPLNINDRYFENPCLAAGERITQSDVLEAASYLLYATPSRSGQAQAQAAAGANQPAGPASVRRYRHACAPFGAAVRAARRDMVGGGGPGAIPSLRIAVAEYVRRSMELMASKRLNRALQLREFFTFDLASCTPMLCAVSVSDRFGSSRLDQDRIDRLRPHIHKFYEELNCGTRAQTYALTPKKDSDIMGLQQFSRTALNLFSQASGVDSVEASKERQARGTLQQASIIGLGDWGQARQPDVTRRGCRLTLDERYARFFPMAERRQIAPEDLTAERESQANFIGLQRRRSGVSTQFGWLILPRPSVLADGGSGEAQVADSLLVSALVSLPSWWGRVRIDVESCWMSRDEVGSILEAQDLCSPETLVKGSVGVRKQDHHLYVKLPGTADEVLSRMAFFPLKSPYLTEGQGQPNVVEVGRPGRVTLLGARLWKNPRVRLGHQWADSVEVLPDMRGLVAYFSCIEPDPGTAGFDQSPPGGAGGLAPSTNRPVRIWTSEGTTSTLSVLARPFQPRGKNGGEGVLPDLTCWEEAKLRKASTDLHRSQPVKP